MVIALVTVVIASCAGRSERLGCINRCNSPNNLCDRFCRYFSFMLVAVKEPSNQTASIVGEPGLQPWQAGPTRMLTIKMRVSFK